MAVEMTPKRQRILELLREPRPYPPSLDELAAEMGITRQTLHVHLWHLRKAGLVTWVDGRSRTLRLVQR